ncbi:MAG: ABC transporter permease subunit, partial [Mogibacterium sp.]|nr:ABC transporter permease subunit [Mogibacterium sp.]
MNLRLWTILLESFPQILLQGIKVTIPLTAVSFLFALLISVIVAMIQYADVPVLKQLCRFYIWIIRGTPLLVQMYVVFYGLPSVGLFLDAWTSAIIVLS